jgi:hypothetical protein
MGFQDKVIYTNDAIHYFYNDMSPEEAEKAEEMLKPHATTTFFSRTTGSAWQSIPSVYIYAELDNAIPLPGQQAMVNGCLAAGADITTETLKSSHSPFYSMPEELVKLIDKHAQ